MTNSKVGRQRDGSTPGRAEAAAEKLDGRSQAGFVLVPRTSRSAAGRKTFSLPARLAVLIKSRKRRGRAVRRAGCGRCGLVGT